MFTRKGIDAGIVVTDIDASLRFYRDFLGLPVVGEAATSLIGKGRMVQLRLGESLIKLVQMDHAPKSNNPKGITSSTGIRYITFLVADIHTMMAKAVQGEFKIAMPIQLLGNGAKIGMVEDPDGNIIEFVAEP